jgi:AcrR family transcriptional regulator
LELLARQGVAGVRVEALAREIGVTKGSFYWHFKDRDALLEAMLAHWRHQATLSVMERIERTHEPAAKRLRRLLQLPIIGKASERGADVELAIRLWGKVDPRAKRALIEVDEVRLRYITSLLTECGITPEAARARAVLAYSYIRVAATLIAPDDTALMTQCEALLLG